MKQFFFYLGLLAGVVLPFFNIPLALAIYRNRSSRNISLTWAVGIWTCIVLMLPQVLLSPDWSFRIFGVANFILFSVVFTMVLYYRKG